MNEDIKGILLECLVAPQGVRSEIWESRLFLSETKEGIVDKKLVYEVKSVGAIFLLPWCS